MKRRKKNPGWFRPGDDPRRHELTLGEERQARLPPGDGVRTLAAGWDAFTPGCSERSRSAGRARRRRGGNRPGRLKHAATGTRRERGRPARAAGPNAGSGWPAGEAAADEGRAGPGRPAVGDGRTGSRDAPWQEPAALRRPGRRRTATVTTGRSPRPGEGRETLTGAAAGAGPRFPPAGGRDAAAGFILAFRVRECPAALPNPSRTRTVAGCRGWSPSASLPPSQFRSQPQH